MAKSHTLGEQPTLGEKIPIASARPRAWRRRSQKDAKPNLSLRIDEDGARFEFLPQSADSADWQYGTPSVHDFLPEDVQRSLMRLVDRASHAGTPQLEEVDYSIHGDISTCQAQVAPCSPDVAPCARRSLLSIIGDISDSRCTHTQLRRSYQQLRMLTGDLQSAREEERTRIAREIHDELGQSLTALKIRLMSLREPPDGRRRYRDDALVEIAGNVDEIIRSVQNIASDLRPKLLDDFGLAAAVEWQAKKFSETTRIDCTCTVPKHPLKAGTHAATGLFRILQEALTNVSRHANASKVTVDLTEDKAWTTLEILDDGNGIRELDTNYPFALGVIGMRERARGLGGKSSITPRAIGGTRVWVRIPV